MATCATDSGRASRPRRTRTPTAGRPERARWVGVGGQGTAGDSAEAAGRAVPEASARAPRIRQGSAANLGCIPAR
eukprot:2802401-Rhodomonas_salina.7